MSSGAADWSKHPVVVLGALLTSILALVLSVVGLKQAHEAQSEQRTTQIDGVAIANQALRTNEGLGLLLSLTNASLRPLILRDAVLFLDGKRIGPATAYLTDATMLARIDLDPGGVVANTQPLPLTLGARDGRTLGLFIDDRVERPYIIDPSKRRGQRSKTFRTWDRILNGAVPKRRHRITLRLRFAPELVERIRVQVSPAGPPFFSWQTSIRGRGSTAVEMGLRRKAGEPGQGDVFRLDIWSKRGGIHRTYERPLVDDRFTAVIVRKLRRGDYLYAFRIGSDAVVTGCVQVPSGIAGSKCAEKA